MGECSETLWNSKLLVVCVSIYMCIPFHRHDKVKYMCRDSVQGLG